MSNKFQDQLNQVKAKDPRETLIPAKPKEPESVTETISEPKPEIEPESEPISEEVTEPKPKPKPEPISEDVKEAFKDYFEQLSRDKIDDRAVRTTIHVDKDISEVLNDICYRKQGLKTKIVNYALRAFLKDGGAIRLSQEYDKLRDNKNKYEKQYFNRILKNLDKGEE